MTKRAERFVERQKWYREVYLLSPHWRALRRIKLRSNPNCEDCGASYGIEVHHVVYRHLFNVTIDCLRSLCRNCHNVRHVNRQSAEAKLARARNTFTFACELKERRASFGKDLARRRKLERAQRHLARST